MKKFFSIFIIIFIVIDFVILGVFSYKVLTHYHEYNKYIKVYKKEVSKMSDDEINKKLEEAIKYNKNLTGEVLDDGYVGGSGFALPTNYMEVLNIDDVIGYIKISKAFVKLPIFHGNDKEKMNRGVIHFNTTSFPVGDLNSNAVLLSHSYMDYNPLFTYIRRLKLDDSFYIYILDKEYEYKVVKIDIVQREDSSYFEIVENKGYVTLVTCNSNPDDGTNLIVRGELVVK